LSPMAKSMHSISRLMSRSSIWSVSVMMSSSVRVVRVPDHRRCL
jgi:hypothetical protein